MLFRDIFIYPSREEFGIDVSYAFRCHTAKFCTFLERYIRPYKITSDYSRICFIGESTPRKTVFLQSTHVLDVFFPFDINEYHTKPVSEYDEYFIRLFEDAIRDYDNAYPVPRDILLGGVEAFRNQGCKNEWELVRKRLGYNKNYYCSVLCSMDFSTFTMTMRIENKNRDIVMSREIYTESPDVFVIGYYLKKGFIESGNTLIFTDKLGTPFFTYELPDEMERS